MQGTVCSGVKLDPGGGEGNGMRSVGMALYSGRISEFALFLKEEN